MSQITVDSTSQWYGSSGSQPHPDICLLHTTEGMSWPGYAGGGEAPHDTIRPLPGVGIQVRRHIPYDSFAKGLVNLAGGVQTNVRGVLQFELMGTCVVGNKGVMYYWPEADDVVLSALADYLRPLLAHYGIPHHALPFKAYPASYGANNGVRLSGDQWDSFHGICGHQHAPENLHGDPGAFPIDRLIAFLDGAPVVVEAPSSYPTVPSTPVPPAKWTPGLVEDGRLGPATITALQRVLGTPQDGKISTPSMMVEALQRFLLKKGFNVGKSGIDGLGFAQDGKRYDTVYALQRYLRTPEDGIMSTPVSSVVKALQTRLNTGSL